jgi:hypothetical protein
MKLNKYIFWITSLTISLISCWLFEKSSTELYTDFDYMQLLELPPDADTPAKRQLYCRLEHPDGYRDLILNSII